MFIKHLNSAAVNLDNVSNIFIDRKTQKIIFNMNYSVRLNGNLTSDYEYWHYTDLSEVLPRLEDILEKQGFILPNNTFNRYVNPKCVSSFKIDEKNKKVIFNLNSTVTHPEDTRLKEDAQRYTSDFVFIKFTNADEFEDYVEKISELFVIF